MGPELESVILFIATHLHHRCCTFTAVILRSNLCRVLFKLSHVLLQESETTVKENLGKYLIAAAQYPPVTWETAPSDVQKVPCMSLSVLISNFYQTEGLTVDE